MKNSIFKLTKQDKIKIRGDISNLSQNHCHEIIVFHYIF